MRVTVAHITACDQCHNSTSAGMCFPVSEAGIRDAWCPTFGVRDDCPLPKAVANSYQVSMIPAAMAFAKKAHGDQKRKYTGEPYFIHPINVAGLVASVTDDEEMVCAAILHDVVEDTPVKLEEIRTRFGSRVADLVSDLTDVSKLEDGKRAVRKAIDRAHTAKASDDAKTIKLADLIDNSRSITQHDPSFSVVYMREKRQLLEVLQGGDKDLYGMAKEIVDTFYET